MEISDFQWTASPAGPADALDSACKQTTLPAPRSAAGRVWMLHVEIDGNVVVHHKWYEGSLEGFLERKRSKPAVTSNKRDSPN